jgi:hypothetical protein
MFNNIYALVIAMVGLIATYHVGMVGLFATAMFGFSFIVVMGLSGKTFGMTTKNDKPQRRAFQIID